MRLDAEWPGGFVNKCHQDGVSNFSFDHWTYTNCREHVSNRATANQSSQDHFSPRLSEQRMQERQTFHMLALLEAIQP